MMPPAVPSDAGERPAAIRKMIVQQAQRWPVTRMKRQMQTTLISSRMIGQNAPRDPGDREHERDDPDHAGAAAGHHEPVGLLLALAAGLVIPALLDPWHRRTG